jgi:hypothetical protein
VSLLWLSLLIDYILYAYDYFVKTAIDAFGFGSKDDPTEKRLKLMKIVP